MRIGLKFVMPVLAGAAAGVAFGLAPTPMSAADPTPSPAPPTVTTTVTTAAAAPGPQDAQACTSSSFATKCIKNGDAEINASIPAPYPGVFGVYGPFWGGG